MSYTTKGFYGKGYVVCDTCGMEHDRSNYEYYTSNGVDEEGNVLHVCVCCNPELVRNNLNGRRGRAGSELRNDLIPPKVKKNKKIDWDDNIPVLKVYWKLLGSKSTPQLFNQIVFYYEKIQERKDPIAYDINRLYEVYKLAPDAIYIGLDEFDGYIVFHFQSIQTAILECPEIGNALYIIKGEWRVLSEMNKRDLLYKYPDRVKRIIHTGEWILKLKRQLRR